MTRRAQWISLEPCLVDTSNGSPDQAVEQGDARREGPCKQENHRMSLKMEGDQYLTPSMQMKKFWKNFYTPWAVYKLATLIFLLEILIFPIIRHIVM